MYLVIAALLATSPAFAAKKAAVGPCDAQKVAVAEAAPQGVPAAFDALAACDPKLAREAAPAAFPRMLAGEAADTAVVTAIKLGLDDLVVGWIDGLEGDQRSKAIARLGETCSVPEVPTFLVATATKMGPTFFKKRGYRALDDCRDPGVVALLEAEVARPADDRAQYSGVLEVYSRNKGAGAIPTIETLLTSAKDDELGSILIGAMADAAGVGQPGGASPEASVQAVAAIVKSVPALGPKGLDQARKTLTTLGAEAESDRVAAARFKDALQADGKMMYGAFVVENATCKKGDVKVEVHHAPVRFASPAWPDQVGERVKSAVSGFDLDLAATCKGTGAVDTSVSERPLKDAAAYDAWIKEQSDALAKRVPGVKVKVYKEEALDI